MTPKLMKLVHVCTCLEIEHEKVVEWINLNLIIPHDAQNLLFDEEDLERMRLIQNLQDFHGANIESAEIILHLLDQIHILQEEIRFLKDKK